MNASQRRNARRQLPQPGTVVEWSHGGTPIRGVIVARSKALRFDTRDVRVQFSTGYKTPVVRPARVLRVIG